MKIEEKIIQILRKEKIIELLCLLVEDDEYGAYTYSELLGYVVAAIIAEQLRVKNDI